MEKILVSGSTAYDYLMKYDDKFEKQFIWGDIKQWSNMSLVVSELDKTTWGTGLNICYNLALLSEYPILITSVGYNFVFEWIIEEKVVLDYVHRSHTLLSASAYITSDILWNQITSFYLGATKESIQSDISCVREDISYGIVSPSKKDAMIEDVEKLFDTSAKVFFDPWQQITEFTKQELLSVFDKVKYLIVNQYEYKELQEKVWMNENELKIKFEKIIVTYNSEGSKIIDTEKDIHILAIIIEEVVDTTWAGDAYRAGLLKWLTLGYDWETSGQIGTILAGYCVEHHGCQNHFFNLSIVMDDMEKKFWKKIDLYRNKKIGDY